MAFRSMTLESYQGNTEYDYEIDAATGTILTVGAQRETAAEEDGTK